MYSLGSGNNLFPVGKEILPLYVKSLRGTIAKWKKYFDCTVPNGFSHQQVQEWINRLESSINALQYKYLFSSMEELNVDLLASGLPHRYSMRLLTHEHKRLVGVPAVSIAELKKAFLEDMRKRKRSNKAILEKISSAVSRQILEKTDPLEMFRIVNMKEVPTDEPGRRYVCTWERYSYRNIPSLYTMYFNLSSGILDEETMNDLALILREETSDVVLLERLGEHIDRGIAPLHPKLIYRIVLGPVFIAHFTMDENPLQVALNSTHSDVCSGSASRIICECIASDGEEPVRQLFDSRGRGLGVIQKFAVREFDNECSERRVTSVEKYLFAPHSTIQVLNEEWRSEINHTFVGG